MTRSSDGLRREKRLGRWDAAFFLLLAAAAAFFCWRCRYGFANEDESFYLTIPHRLVQGDRLLIDEWHVSQLSSVLLYLPVLLFERVTGGTDGIYLAARYLGVLVQCLAAAPIYFRLRRFSRPGALLGALALAVYTPFGINALSYHSLGVLFMALTGALLAPAGRESRAAYVLAGLCFAGAVLCCPPLVLLYLLYALAALLLRKKAGALPALSGRAFGLFTLGAAILAAAFFLVGLAGADLSRLPGGLRGVFSDPEHTAGSSFPASLGKALLNYPVYVFYNGYWRSGACLIPVLLLAPAARLDKRREEHAAAYLLAGLVLTAAAEIQYLAVKQYINFMMYAVNVLALLCFAIAPREESDALRRLGWLWWLPGMLYSGLILLASNQRYFAIFNAAASAVPASITVIVLTARRVFAARKRPLRRAAAAAAAVLLLAQIGGTAFLRYWFVFWDNDIRFQTETIAEGTHKGLVVEPERAGQYATTRRAMAGLESRSGGGMALPLTRNTWMYLGDYRNASYSAWLSGVKSSTIDRLAMYYALNPERLPAAVWAAEEHAEFAEEFCARFRYTIEQTPDGLFLTPDE